MTERKWTKGPWVNGYDRGDAVIKSSEGETLMCNMNYYPWNSENPADWDLIAAAPDLYEALEYMMVCHRDPHDKECERAMDMTVTALAKARGENNASN